MAEARAVALAGEVGRVARHVGLEGIGDALRTAVLFAPPPQKKAAGGAYACGAGAEDEDDLFELGAGGIFAGLEAEAVASRARVAGDAAGPPMAPPSPERVSRTAPAHAAAQTSSHPPRRVTWEVDGGDL